jgi:hypothetical protein
MFNIGDFLKRFTVIKDPANLKNDVSLTIESVTGQKIATENITIQGGKLILQVHPVIKSIVFLKKEKLLEELKEKFPESGFKIVI